MGGVVGHTVAGSFFLLFSFWWFIGNLLRAKSAERNPRRRPLLNDETASAASTARFKFNQRPWFMCPGVMGKVPIEPFVKIVSTACGIIVELAPANHRTLFDENGEFLMDNLNDYGHVTMYGFFTFSGVVDLVMWYKLLPLPAGSDYLALSMAFLVEGMLFYFHLGGRSELDVRMHTILYTIIFVSAGVLLVGGVIWRNSPLPSILLAYLTSLQGSWFVQIGISLHGANVWENTPANVMVVSILLAWHMMFWLASYLIVFAFAYHVIARRCFTLEHTTVEEQDDGEIIGLMEM